MRVRFDRLIEREAAIDRQRQLARRYCVPQIRAHAAADLAHLVERTGAEGHADIVDTAQRVQIEVELGLGAGEAADIDHATEQRHRLHGLRDHRSGEHINDKIDPFAVGRLQHRIGPARIARVDGKIGTEFLQPRPARVVGGGADHRFRAHELGDLQAHQPDARAGALNHHALAGTQAAGGHQRVVQGDERDRQGRGLFKAHAIGDRVDAPPVAHGIFGIAAGARAHHPVAGLEAALNLGAGLDHLACPVDADRRADATVAAVREATGGREIGAIEAGGAHLDQHLVGLRARLRHVAHVDPLFACNASLHRVLRRCFPRLSWPWISPAPRPPALQYWPIFASRPPGTCRILSASRCAPQSRTARPGPSCRATSRSR